MLQTMPPKRRAALAVFAALCLIIVVLSAALLTSAIKSNSAKDEAMEQLQRTIAQLIDDTTEIRGALDIPPVPYENRTFAQGEEGDAAAAEFSASASDAAGEKSPHGSELLSEQAEHALLSYRAKQDARAFETLLAQNGVENIFSAQGFEMQRSDFTLYIKFRGSIVATLHGAQDGESLTVSSAITDAASEKSAKKFDAKSDAKAAKKSEAKSAAKSAQSIAITKDALAAYAAALRASIENNLALSEKTRRAVQAALQSAQARDYLRTFNARQNAVTANNAVVWRFYTVLGEQVFRVRLDLLKPELVVQYDAVAIQSAENAAGAVLEKLLKVDFAIKELREANKVLEKLSRQLQTPAVQKSLASLGLSVAQSFSETDDYYYFDLFERADETQGGQKSQQKDGPRIGAFALQKSTGGLWLTDEDYILREPFALSDESMEQTALAKGIETIVVIGSNENLADTIMLAVLNSKKNSVDLINIPRDLYYRGQKINWYFKRYSAKNFTDLLSSVLGVPIRKYISVDMYSFVHVVNALGGITVYLQEDLIDPTYKIKENGAWKTLNYPKGEYVFSGIEALRVVRSRHSTSDFGRSERQQAVIEAVQQKVRDLDAFSSTISLLKILRTVRPYISTNMNIRDIAQTAVSYRNAPIAKHIIDTSNILYYTFTNLYFDNLNREDVDERYELGQYILLPRGGDWDLIKRYVRNIIEQ